MCSSPKPSQILPISYPPNSGAFHPSLFIKQTGKQKPTQKKKKEREEEKETQETDTKTKHTKAQKWKAQYKQKPIKQNNCPNKNNIIQ